MQGNYRIGHTNIGGKIAGAMASKNKAVRAPIIKANQKKEREESRANSQADAYSRIKMREHEKRKTIKYKTKQDVKKYEGKAKVALNYKQQVASLKASNQSAKLKGRTNAPKNDLEVKKKRTVDTPRRRVAKANKI